MKNLSECRILIVDDSEENLSILVGGLKSDYRLSAVKSGENALKTAARNPPDLVLLDIIMPGMDGYEVCRRLRKMPETAEVPIMFLSSLEDLQNKVIGFEAGANDYLTKPFEMLEVRARVHSLLKVKAYNDAVKEHIAAELKTAHEIQMGMLPHNFSELEKAFNLEISAVLLPAYEVGGDLYGVHASDRNRLTVFLGDVSGKGIPASLFMIRAISIARLLSRESNEPNQILSKLNDELCADNPYSMFVTFLCADYNPNTGILTVANAGQCRPVLLRKGKPPVWAVSGLGTALGLEPGLKFEQTKISVQSGDAMLFYTDGVSEALNSNDDVYGSEQIITDADKFKNESASAITAGLLQRVHSFAGKVPQSDDIAILTLRFKNTYDN
ncbi:MAG TPA: SpoIIE family protein phosphatase [Leptospiraceae bacterium]|nr:SpoIIE family protein phosphatase [Leptospiraceae bacterium]HNF25321.1 SpoIIE family protein phosphatase [Leptospiraceae bacterium]HNH07240.1 SpoIIE family protein phosphatase [Leptospiraceae bacterium]